MSRNKRSRRHLPGDGKRPVSREQLDRLDRWAWELDPAGYARRVWKQINRLAGGER